MVIAIVTVDVFLLLLWTFVNPMEVNMHSLPREVRAMLQAFGAFGFARLSRFLSMGGRM